MLVHQHGEWPSTQLNVTFPISFTTLPTIVVAGAGGDVQCHYWSQTGFQFRSQTNWMTYIAIGV